MRIPLDSYLDTHHVIQFFFFGDNLIVGIAYTGIAWATNLTEVVL
jgi:hypothetical protein